jgi:LPS O-antigen subunit length determinant protein (WzzB/FepE family)
MHTEDKIDLNELFGVFWAGKLKIILITAIFAICSVFYSLSLDNQYKASVTLAPASGGVSDSLSRLGGIASFAGISLRESSSGNEAMLAREIMQSWSFIEGFIKDNDLQPILFAIDRYDEELGQIIYNQDVYDTENKTWLPNIEIPSSWNLYESFTGILSVEDDKRSGLTIVSIEYISPELAKELIDLYISSINKYMQSRKIQMLTKNIEYLEAQIDASSKSEMREVFFAIISEQIKEKMMAEATPDYAFVTVSPSMIPEKRSQPNRAMICIIGSIIGAIFSIFLVLILNYGRKITE